MQFVDEQHSKVFAIPWLALRAITPSQSWKQLMAY